MNTATAIAEHTQPTLHPLLTMNDSNNRALHSMTACAQVAVEGLDALGMHVLSVTVHGAKPVIEIMNTTIAVKKFTAFNSKNWQIHHGVCPVRKQTFTQFFVEYRECLITWIKWR